MSDNTGGERYSAVQRWTGHVSPSSAGGFVAYGDYLTLQRALAAATAEVERLKQDALAAIPSNWCDPLLTGDKAVLPLTEIKGSHVESLLNGIRERVREAIDRPVGGRTEG